jgi:hypothetical protein
MDPLAAWVDLEPPLAAAGSEPAMAAAASQGATRVEGDATAGCETSPSCGKERSSMLAIAGSQAMKDPSEEPLNGGASTHRWSRAPARGPAAAPSLSPIRLMWLLLRHGRERRKCARVQRREN